MSPSLKVDGDKTFTEEWTTSLLSNLAVNYFQTFKVTFSSLSRLLEVLLLLLL